MMMRESANPSAFFTLMAGGLAGTFSWLVSFPVDVVKSRLQVDGIDGKPKYNGAMDCMKKSYAAEGMSFFTRGLTSTLLRAFPMNAVCFLVVSYVMKFFENSKTIEVSLAQPELLAVDGVVDSRYQSSFIMRVFDRQHNNNHPQQITSTISKYLIFLDGFHEAGCHSDMMELSDLRTNSTNNSYFQTMNSILNTKIMSNEEMRVPLILTEVKV